MFSKLHQHQTHPFSHQFQLSPAPESDDTSPNQGPKDVSPKALLFPAAVEMEPASKSFADSGGVPRVPKTSPRRNDIVEAVSRFSRRKNIGICVLTGSGTVSNVSLGQPSSATPGGTITFHGRFDILSLSATFSAQTTSCHVPNTIPISLAGSQGQIFGGIVAGPLVAASNVFLVAATFNNPSYHRLPGEEEGRNTVSSGGAGGQSPPLSGGGADSCGVSMYSNHLGGSDVIWAPTARAPPPPPPYQ
ncbi:AT-hook motif nuclear-localized protein 17 [Hibiscus syriacus]|uniref:AT-hook motif nuclear-localized protein 17 n=1 Tax=Hibiscus syriacus TaxID=106335 RepID=A0A6A3BGP6_HIBSY|nr:AT-hook motif nuclear-localized protein 17 [Hibiscus syriacus]